MSERNDDGTLLSEHVTDEGRELVIDHAEAKRIAERVLTGGVRNATKAEAVFLARSVKQLLTDHSARDYALVQVEYLLDPATGSPRPTEALRVARRALPATEPAQPEEEPK